MGIRDSIKAMNQRGMVELCTCVNLRIMNLKDINVRPVSYTHLDVYKRQQMYCVNRELDFLVYLRSGSCYRFCGLVM